MRREKIRSIYSRLIAAEKRAGPAPVYEYVPVECDILNVAAFEVVKRRRVESQGGY